MERVAGSELRALLEQSGERAWLEIVLRHGKTFRLGSLVVTADPRLVQALLLDPANAARRSLPHRLISRLTPGSRGLLFLDGEPWRRHLQAVQAAFERRHVAGHAALVHQTTMRHARAWAAAGPDGIAPDLAGAVTDLGRDIVLPAGYGLDPADALGAELGRELVAYKQFTMRPQPRYRIDQLGLGARKLLDLGPALQTVASLRQRVRRLRRLVYGIAAARRGCPHPQPNWLDGLLASGMPLDEVTDEVNHLYGAYNAVDYVTTAALYELSRHPHWRHRLRAELQQALPPDAYPVPADRPRLPLTWGVLEETLRLYPVAMGIFRQTGTRTAPGALLVVDGETLAPGTQVVVLPYALHRHPDYWADPHTFDPGRWHRPPMPRVPHTYIPFLRGPRRCIGRHLAEMQLLVVVSTLVRHFQLDVLDPAAQTTPFLIPRFAGALPFRIRPLQEETAPA
jgi:cytochrome P450